MGRGGGGVQGEGLRLSGGGAAVSGGGGVGCLGGREWACLVHYCEREGPLNG